ncbi:glutamate synthase large subunit [Evtepia sp.]|uniref:glutamate synthase large subunit n=1 Tax=Evtepia sp. TaxID=2773933 RepID=UPI002A81C897|nr:glutamate synthase large subunit [Evtepia sp.]MDY4430996.1 glutamate synthase large subunit [Evtepia sp.]
MERSSCRLYDERFEHDSCGIGAVVNIAGTRSYRTVDSALKIVEKLEHRAGKDASGQTGDGVGILLQISHSFFSAAAAEQGIHLEGPRSYAVGMFFFPQDRFHRSQRKKLFEILVEKDGMEFLGWRQVPVNPQVLGQRARDCMPAIWQGFVRRPEKAKQDLDFDRRLYIVRREYEQSVRDTYVASLSCRTIVYKGMFLVHQLRQFYGDLQDTRYETAIALVHSRFSTNTNPSWERAHPNRLLLHNGEINTIRGNVYRMLAREETMNTEALDSEMEKILPVVDPSGSDSAMLDNTLEFLMFSGMELPKAVMVTIPEPWSRNRDMPRGIRDMYHYYATMMEPWDGPAAILFSDGDVVGACLDRNGLRPARYYETDDGFVILSSEVGVLDIPPEHIVRKGRLGPGKMLLVDTVAGKLQRDGEIKGRYASANPYGEWLDRELVTLDDLPAPNRRVPVHDQALRDKLYTVFGYTYEDVRQSILPMAKAGHEPTMSMGSDIPLAVLSDQQQPLFNYFKQLFAQVTNPPIDALREEIVTDTSVYVGSDGNLLCDTPENCRVLQLSSPILTSMELLKLKNMKMPGLQAETVSLLYFKNSSLERALDHLFVSCDKAYRNGSNVIILSDRGVDENHVAIPSLLAVSALEQHLIRTKKRTAVSVVLESAEPRDVHHFAALLGFGARAVNPYLAHECIGELIEKELLDKDYYSAVEDFNKAILDGVVSIAAKMGIFTIQSYQSAQIFEAVGISRKVIDHYFTGTVSRVGGIGLGEIEEGVTRAHDRAFDPMKLTTDPTIDAGGMHKLRSGTRAERHRYNPQTILALQKAVQEGSYEDFRVYTGLADRQAATDTLRGQLVFRQEGLTPIPLEEVEPVESIVRRFKTGAMSYGSISQEAHECLAVAMNTLGGKSNAGEGGEAVERLGTIKNSAIKQVASGRFGVTSQYLVSASEIQIKMAQGAKPGEGGHLPGRKAWPWIARTRCSTPGVPLISPPPHHDIYSIEDLAELIFDLKNANKDASITVKLVSEAGVGTIAAGVAKAGAQTVLISGCDGGTGAAPKNSIYNAGLPWEIGLAEAHQTLLSNGLRTRVRLEVDGKLMTGRDVAVACALGAEEFGFATAPLVAMGCMMLRVCSLDTCAMGIATQDPELRKNFRGKPEYVMNFMVYIARELREILAGLGLRSVDELVGRTDLLQTAPQAAGPLDISSILAPPPEDGAAGFRPEDVYDFHLEETADERKLLPILEGVPCGTVEVSSTDRAFGTMLGAEITRRFGTGLPEDTYRVKCRGGAGQSFGAFLPAGLTLELEGDSNDYFGKGLSGGKLVIYPSPGSTFDPGENVIVGNVALYGATGGKAFLGGVAGERFCVRNSGAVAVVEGVGDHGCEYMTGGRVAVIGRTGRNFAAGMSGGVVYVLDTAHDLYRRVNKDMVTVEPLTEKYDIAQLKEMLSEHLAATASPRAADILENFDVFLKDFKKIIPRDYSSMTERIAEYEAKGLTREQAELEAFLKRGV